MLRDALLEHRQPAGHERFAALHLEVHDLPHRRRARVTDDAAASERAGAELHPSPKPSDNRPRLAKRGDAVREFPVVEPIVVAPVLLEVALDHLVREGRPEIRRPLRVASAPRGPRPVEILVPDEKRRAERPSRVPGRGLDPQVLKRPLPQDAPVAGAIEDRAAREAQPLHARLPMRVPGDAEHDLLGDLLYRARHIHLAPRDLGFAPPRRSAEEIRETRVRHPEPGAVVEVLHIEAERSVLPQIDELAHDEIDVARLAAGRELHEHALVRVALEAGEMGERRVEEPERMRKPYLLAELDTVVAADAPARRRPLADAVDDHDRRLAEGRWVERGRGVRLVALGEENLPFVSELLPNDRGNEELLPEPARHRGEEGADPSRRVRDVCFEDALERENGLVVEDDGVEIGGGDARLGEAVSRRVPRKIEVVLLPRETLLLRGGDDLAVHDERRGAVAIEGGDAQYVHRFSHSSNHSRMEAYQNRAFCGFCIQ